MEEKLVRSVENILRSYISSDVVAGYTIKKDLVHKILDFYMTKRMSNSRKRNISVMCYLIAEAYTQHCDISDEASGNGIAVIYGDYFCTLYYRAVTDLKEYRLNEEIISRYKRMCIGSFEGRRYDPIPFLTGDRCS